MALVLDSGPFFQRRRIRFTPGLLPRARRARLAVLILPVLLLTACQPDPAGADWSGLLAALLAGASVEEPAGPGLPAGVASINYRGEFNAVTERDAMAVAPTDSAELAAALANGGPVFYDSLGELIRPLRIRFTGDLAPGVAPAVAIIDDGGNPIAGAVSVQYPRTLLFTPTAPFAQNSRMSAAVTGVSFADGRSRLSEPLEFEFGTARATPGMPFDWSLEINCPDGPTGGGAEACRLRLHPPATVEFAMANPEAGDFPAFVSVYAALSGANFITECFFTEDQFVIAPGSNGLYFEFPNVSPQGYYELYRYAADPAAVYDANLFFLASVDYTPAGASPPVQEMVVAADGAWNMNLTYSRTQ